MKNLTSVYGPCDLCVNPYPFMCSECTCEADDGDRHGTVEKVGDAVPHIKVMGMVAVEAARNVSRIWIGSGEDFLPA